MDHQWFITLRPNHSYYAEEPIRYYKLKEDGNLEYDPSKKTIKPKKLPPKIEILIEKARKSAKEWKKLIRYFSARVPKAVKRTIKNTALYSQGVLSALLIRNVIIGKGLSTEELGMVRERNERRSKKEWIDLLRPAARALKKQGIEPTPANVSKALKGKPSAGQIVTALLSHDLSYSEVKMLPSLGRIGRLLEKYKKEIKGRHISEIPKIVSEITFKTLSNHLKNNAGDFQKYDLKKDKPRRRPKYFDNAEFVKELLKSPWSVTGLTQDERRILKHRTAVPEGQEYMTLGDLAEKMKKGSHQAVSIAETRALKKAEEHYRFRFERKPLNPKRLGQAKIERLGYFDSRIRRAFKKLRIVTISDLLKVSPERFLKLKNLKERSLTKIKKRLAANGLKWAARSEVRPDPKEEKRNRENKHTLTEAEKWLNKASELKFDHEDLHERLKILEQALHYRGKAIHLLDKVKKDYPNKLASALSKQGIDLVRIAKIYEEWKQRPQAIESYKKALQKLDRALDLNPGNERAKTEKGLALIWLGQNYLEHAVDLIHEGKDAQAVPFLLLAGQSLKNSVTVSPRLKEGAEVFLEQVKTVRQTVVPRLEKAESLKSNYTLSGGQSLVIEEKQETNAEEKLAITFTGPGWDSQHGGVQADLLLNLPSGWVFEKPAVWYKKVKTLQSSDGQWKPEALKEIKQLEAREMHWQLAAKRQLIFFNANDPSVIRVLVRRIDIVKKKAEFYISVSNRKKSKIVIVQRSEVRNDLTLPFAVTIRHLVPMLDYSAEERDNFSALTAEHPYMVKIKSMDSDHVVRGRMTNADPLGPVMEYWTKELRRGERYQYSFYFEGRDAEPSILPSALAEDLIREAAPEDYLASEKLMIAAGVSDGLANPFGVLDTRTGEMNYFLDFRPVFKTGIQQFRNWMEPAKQETFYEELWGKKTLKPNKKEIIARLRTAQNNLSAKWFWLDNSKTLNPAAREMRNL